MKLSDIERYEINAEAFRIMTGHMAPGKDPSPASQSSSYEERYEAFKKWLSTNGECARAMLIAFERVMPEDNDYE